MRVEALHQIGLHLRREGRVDAARAAERGVVTIEDAGEAELQEQV